MARNTAARLGGLAVGVAAGWNISNTGAAATTLHDAYGVSLAAVGLLTTALFATHFAAQVPAGALIDRFGARAVALGALAVISIGNAVALTTPAYWLAVVARLLIGSGTGSGFVAGSDWVRAAGGSTAAQGVYGGVSVGGGGFAIGIVPLLTTGLGWRAPYATALAIALLCAVSLRCRSRSSACDGLRPGRPGRCVRCARGRCGRSQLCTQRPSASASSPAIGS